MFHIHSILYVWYIVGYIFGYRIIMKVKIIPSAKDMFEARLYNRGESDVIIGFYLSILGDNNFRILECIESNQPY